MLLQSTEGIGTQKIGMMEWYHNLHSRKLVITITRACVVPISQQLFKTFEARWSVLRYGPSLSTL